MIWTADRIIYKGRAHRGFGLDVAHNGRVRKIAPLSEMSAPQHVLMGQAIVFGRINPYHHSLGLVHRMAGARLQQPAPVGWADADNVWDTWAHRLSPADMFVVARAAFLAALKAGITCVGEVYSLRYTPAGEPYPEGAGMAEAIIQAAQDVGLRVALIDNVRLRHPAPDVAPQPKCLSAPNLEAALEGFDSLVTRILTRHDARLSWALGAHSLDSVPYDSLVSMRVRLGHMPFFLPQPAEAGAQARALRRYGHDPFVTLARREMLDACVSIVATSGLPRACAAAVTEVGTAICLSYPPQGPMVETPWSLTQKDWAPAAICVATGSADPRGLGAAFADWPAALEAGARSTPAKPLVHMAQAFEKSQRVAAAALGVDAGDLGPGQWADFVTIALPEAFTRADAAPEALAAHPDEEAMWAADAILGALCKTGIEPYLRDVFIAGTAVLEQGQHRLQAQSDAAMAALVTRLLETD